MASALCIVRVMAGVKSSMMSSASAISSNCEASYASALVGLETSVIARAVSGSEASRANILAKALSVARCGWGDAAGNCFTSARGLVAPSSSGSPLMRPSMICQSAFMEPSSLRKTEPSAPSIHSSGKEKMSMWPSSRMISRRAWSWMDMSGREMREEPKSLPERCLKISGSTFRLATGVRVTSHLPLRLATAIVCVGR